MRLSELLRTAGVTAEVRGDAEVSAVVSDSRQARSGALFVCMPSGNADSHAFIANAAAQGAVAALVHAREGLEAAASAGVAAAFVERSGLSFNDAVWRIAKTIFGNPSAKMKTIGVTGTNGKTTTAWLLRDALTRLGERAAYLGTLGFHLPDETRELSNTTPFAIELNALLAEAVARGATALAMEVSSHALEERRVDGVEFDAAIFTNLTQDHLDFHGTMEAYERAKWRLFTELPTGSSKCFEAALNVDDPVGARWAGALTDEGVVAQLYTLNVDRAASLGDPEDVLVGEPLEVRVDRLRLRLTLGEESHIVEAPLGGSYNVENVLGAAAGLLALDYPLEAVAEALRGVRPVPGRFEAVPNDQGIGVLVDYAHTPDALEKLLDSVRALSPRRVITVFGCGGDRDRRKRPLMARAASDRSDLTVVTSDNPRTEDPQSILNEIQAGIVPGRDSVSIVDRREAIHYALKAAVEGDVVVIAGKGHEDYQIIGRTKYPMDDRQMAREALEARA